MTNKFPTTLADDFNALRLDEPEGWLVLETVLDPILLVSRNGDRYRVRLAAQLNRRAGTLWLEAPDLGCNWVAGDGLIYPLPRDVEDLVSNTLSTLDPNDLSFANVLELRRAASAIRVEFDESVWVPAKDEAARTGPIVVPSLAATLYEYQARGVAWMQLAVEQTGGVILADEMGLGKTIQIISLLLLDRPAQVSPALVVCPTTLIANWVRELSRFAPDLTVLVHRGSDRARIHRHLMQSSVVVTTYETLVNDLVLFKAINWSWLICDEAQAIKNPESQRRKAIAQLPRRRTIPVTGTPVENHLLDMWSLIDIAVPGLLGSQSTFEAAFPDTNASACALAELTAPVVLRRQVKDVAADLPDRIDVAVPLELGKKLATDYEKVRQDALDKYLAAGPMVAVGQLQLFCAHPSLNAKAIGRDGWEDSAVDVCGEPTMTPKLERAIELVAEAFASHKKVLLFANFNACGPILRAAINPNSGVFWDAINGSTPSATRQSIVDAFTEHGGPGILVLNPRAAGSGLNITAATVVVHFTQVWNPALELQASARAHRRGQTEPVTVYHMFYLETVEQVMMERAQQRRELGSEAVPPTQDEPVDLARALHMSPVHQ